MPCKFRCLRLAVSISTACPRLACCGTAHTLQRGTFTHRTSNPLLGAPYRIKKESSSAAIQRRILFAKNIRPDFQKSTDEFLPECTIVPQQPVFHPDGGNPLIFSLKRAFSVQNNFRIVISNFQQGTEFSLNGRFVIQQIAHLHI
mgnify:CR=1 FL=1